MIAKRSSPCPDACHRRIGTIGLLGLGIVGICVRPALMTERLERLQRKGAGLCPDGGALASAVLAIDAQKKRHLRPAESCYRKNHHRHPFFVSSW